MTNYTNNENALMESHENSEDCSANTDCRIERIFYVLITQQRLLFRIYRRSTLVQI